MGNAEYMGQFRSMHLLAAALVLLGSVSAQDTYHCPDGWFWHEGHGGRGHCYFFSMEQLSKMNGEILCASHGGWIVEIPHPGVNYWIKAMLLDLYTPDKQEKAGVPWGNLFWMGAVTEDRHDDHVNGNWWWPHANASVQWFDWGDNEPNDFHGQNCMTFMEYRNPIFQNYRDYFWNDSDCTNDVAHYICVKDCADCSDQETTAAATTAAATTEAAATTAAPLISKE